jgi:hypothetical protein
MEVAMCAEVDVTVAKKGTERSSKCDLCRYCTSFTAKQILFLEMNAVCIKGFSHAINPSMDLTYGKP